MAETENTQDKTRVAQQQNAQFRRAYKNRHENYIKIAQKCDRFYCGEQWSPEDKAVLEEEQRPALTINQILPTVNIALGEQVARRADIRFKPKRGSATSQSAEILTKLVDHILDENRFAKEIEPEVYADGLIQDRGYYDVRIDFDENPLGEVRITSVDPLTVIPDPDAKSRNTKHWNQVFTINWMTMDEIEQMYGKDKADEIRSFVSSEHSSGFGQEFIDLKSNTFGDTPEVQMPGTDDVDEGKKTIRNVRVIERQHRVLTNRKFYIDQITGESIPVPDDTTDEQMEEFLKMPGNENITVISRRVKRVRWTVTALDVVLHDDWSIYRSFTIIPYFPYFRRGQPFGMVRNLLDPQEFFNKTRSQELHIINTTANSGWILEEGSLANMTTDELAQVGAKTGVVLSINPGTTFAPQKIKPNPVPTGLDRLSEKGQMDIRSISSINEAMLGEGPAYVSGVALEQKQARGQVQLQVPFASLELARQALGEKILELVQDFYTEERVFFITDYTEPGEPQEEMIINQQIHADGVYKIINDVNVGEYDVVISSSPARDTFDEMQLGEAASLRAAGVPIPSYLMVKYSHLKDKENLSAVLKQMEGFSEPSPEEQQMAQVEREMLMARAQLELAEMQEKVRKLQSESMLNMAKVADLGEGGVNKSMLEFEQKRQLQREGLAARLQMSQMSSQTTKEKQQMAQDGRMASEAMKYAHTNYLEEFRALSRIAEKQITPPAKKGTSNE